MSETEGPDEVGSVGEEAARLLGALAGWATEHGGDLGAGVSGLADHAVGAARSVDEHLATGAAECTYCPVCRAVHAVREVSPEVREHLAVAASSLVQAAAGFLVSVSKGAPPEDRGPVERIDLDDDGQDPVDPWPEEQQ